MDGSIDIFLDGWINQLITLDGWMNQLMAGCIDA